MSHNIYDEAAYRQFADNLPHALSGRNIRRMKLKQLRKPSFKTGTRTKYKSRGWRAFVSSRIGPKTVYLGSKSVIMPNPTSEHQNIIKDAPEELHKVLQLLRELPMVHLRRQMCKNDNYNPICNLYISVANPISHRLAYMWGTTMSDVDPRRPGPEFTMIHIPDEDRRIQQVLALPEHHINVCLGSDYMGEDKKGFLRQAMWYADEHDMLGLHAGTKLVTVRDAKDGKLKRYGVYLFGLSATGKSTWSCHRLGLDESKGERTEVIQDDVVFLRSDGSSHGSEANFFVKTDVDPDLQEAMYNTLIDPSALYENVMINADGEPLFLDERLCHNGRSVISKDKVRVRMGRKLVSIASDSFDLPPLEELDGIIFAFITRRNTIKSFAQELTPEQGVLAYLWGESTHSAASEPDKAGKSVRTVGTDPFIVGSRARKVNRFRDIVMGLLERYPDKVRFMQYNTGGMGEIIKIEDTTEGKKKLSFVKTQRVPIPLMAAIQRGDLHGTNGYELGQLGTKRIVSVEGFDMSPYEPNSLMTPSR
ncbi:MAG: phosphoenolpyruvate carboxykinase (ATP) [Candidatus Electryoneaceae bacterium]|nr:phosphoenolpyruvate carboxykinase (ATP) [Candidatus Electryoneaceae bacterium]